VSHVVGTGSWFIAVIGGVDWHSVRSRVVVCTLLLLRVRAPDGNAMRLASHSNVQL
jgi:hypothetical protein